MPVRIKETRSAEPVLILAAEPRTQRIGSEDALLKCQNPKAPRSEVVMIESA
jgi:hypothetical protein